MFEILRAAALRTEDDDHWRIARRPVRDSDLALTGATRAWLRKLPPRRRPLRLCAGYPRVGNRLSWCWPDAELAAQTLQDLLTDSRGGRRGFPAEVQRELRRLQEFNAAQRVERGDDGLLPAIGRIIGVA